MTRAAFKRVVAGARALRQKARSLWPAEKAQHVKPSTLRYKMRCADIDAQVSAAMRSGDYTNPYPPGDRRHARFARNLHQRRAAQILFDM